MCSAQLISFEIESTSKEINRAEHEYMNMSPSLIALATLLLKLFPDPNKLRFNENYLYNIDGVKVREAALHVCSEQLELKHEFDYFIKLETERGSPSQGLHNNSRKGTSKRTVSSRISSLSRKRERLTVAQLRVKQIARKHEIVQKMLQLQNENELLKAQVEIEEAELRVSMCEQAIQEEREEDLLDVDKQIIQDVRQEITKP